MRPRRFEPANDLALGAAWLVGLQVSASRASLATASGEALLIDLGFWGIVLPTAVVAFAMTGLLITLRRPANALGWLCLVLALEVRPESRPRDLVFRWSSSKEPPSTGESVFDIRAARSAAPGVPAKSQISWGGPGDAGDGPHERQSTG